MIDDDCSELDILRYRMYADRYNEENLSLVIAPTSNCNFRCPYCFESSVLRNCRMDESIKKGILQFVNSKIKTIKHLDVCWYGGEPLLELNTIKEMSNEFISICDAHKVEYNAGIITNGYLLTQSTLTLLIDAKVSNVQITLDGIKEDHDSRRYLIGKLPTFDTIIENLLSLSSIYKENIKFPRICIRMNVDKSNVNGVDRLMEYLYSLPLKDYVFFYIAAVYDSNDINNEYTFTHSEYLEIYRKYLKKIKKFIGNDYELYYPKLISAACGCERVSSFVIDADGSLYKCWEQIGNKEFSVGNINDDSKDYGSSWFYKCIVSDPTHREECKNCIILPSCMAGGCPHRVNKMNFAIDCIARKKAFRNDILSSYNALKTIKNTE